MAKVLVTSASFQSVPGGHRQLLNQQAFEIDMIRGPLKASAFLPIIADYDALLCGDNEVTAEVLQTGKQGKMAYISKYGVGVDKIDIAKAKELNIPVTICPGVNQHAVAELVFGLLLSFARSIHLQYAITKNGGWQKLVGQEIHGKTIGIVGFGAIGKEVAKRAKAFGMEVVITTAHPDKDYIKKEGYHLTAGLYDLAAKADVITLHTPLTPQTRELISEEFINTSLKRGAIIINTARGGLVNAAAIQQGLETGIIGGYLTDVLDIEPMPEGCALKDAPNVLITPHIGSRTYQSAERQGIRAVENLVNMLAGNVEAYGPYMAY